SQRRKGTPRKEDSAPTGHAGRAVGLAIVEILRLAKTPHSVALWESRAQLQARRLWVATPERLPSVTITRLREAAASRPGRRTKPCDAPAGSRFEDRRPPTPRPRPSEPLGSNIPTRGPSVASFPPPLDYFHQAL